jgi:hypothetical protein
MTKATVITRVAHLLALLVFAGQTAALAQSRWVELDYDTNTITYDLTTVQMLDPGRFTIISNIQDHPDIIRLKLDVLTALKSYCGRPDGKTTRPPSFSRWGLPTPTCPLER